MGLPIDPYNLNEVLDACAKHAWETRAAELQRRGVESESQLREVIAHTVEAPETRAFRAPTNPDRNQNFGREVYDKRPFDNEGNKEYGITIVLNPNRDGDGQVIGGTCHIQKNNSFESKLKSEEKILGAPPEIVTGGRSALRDQESHRQLAPQEQKLEPEQGNAIDKPKQEPQLDTSLFKPLPGQSAEDHARNMEQVEQRREQVQERKPEISQTQEPQATITEQNQPKDDQPEKPTYKPLPGQSAEDHARNMEQIEQRRVQQQLKPIEEELTRGR